MKGSAEFSMMMQSFLMLARAQNRPKTHKKLIAFHLKTKACLYFILVFKQELKDSINDKQDNMISQPRQCQSRECQCVESSPGSNRIMQRWLRQSVQLLWLDTNHLITFFSIKKVGNYRVN